ncbi:MAG: AMP-binding protein [Deltaproteobacteria bacterium]|nr:AMP-binding protein [Deltaproteobacteria bacterium]
MMCVSRSEVARVVTIQTSGATDAPKRLYFTDLDLELTVDFFHHGMTTLALPGARVLILMPGRTPGSIGDLLKKALVRMNAVGQVHGPINDPGRAVDDLLDMRADCLVGLPIQVLGLVRHPRGRDIPKGLIRSVLLSADYVPDAVVDELEERWESPVFEHYGMTEMGLGGGVQCEVREGYHLREADLLFEIIDPETGNPVPDGEPGEVVFTTLTRQGMPLIRYRTGDLARFLPGPCPCGSSLRRLEKVRGRIAGRVPLEAGGSLSLPEMDEVLFRVPGILNYRAELTREKGRDRLGLQVYSVPEGRPSWRRPEDA